MAVGDPCDICGSPIPRGSGPRKRCSDACRRVAASRRERNLYTPDPAKVVEYMNRYKARHPDQYRQTLANRPRKSFEAQRAAGLWTLYRLTVEEYDAMEHAQEGRCAICRRFESGTVRGRPRPLAVDHDHLTGAVRGLLCSRCNSVLGFIEDKALFTAATDYLRRHESAEEAIR